MVVKYIPKVLKTKQTTCKELIKTSESSCIQNFTKLYDSVWGTYVKAPEADTANFMAYIEKIFVFALIWSVGAPL